MKPAIDSHVHQILDKCLLELEECLKGDLIFYSGDIVDGLVKDFRNFIEEVKADNKYNRLCFILRTLGGSATAVERMVNIIRHNYDEVHIFIPDYAMSAGTIFCMSGDEIYMDYSACLGPIDPQVEIGDHQLVPALGYLDKVNELIKKSANNTLTAAEFALLQSQDLAKLRSYEQAKELSIALLKDWLVKYKFKNWTIHKSDPAKKDKPVTEKEKIERAKQIAGELSNNSRWHSHGRPLNIDVLRELKLQIIDLDSDLELRKKIRFYSDLICDYIDKQGFQFFFHSRKFI